MKKILALMLAGTMLVFSAVCAYAADGSSIPGTPSAEASYWRSVAEQAQKAADTANSLASETKDALDKANKTIEETKNTNKEMQKQLNNYAKLAQQQSSQISKLNKQAGDYENKLKAVNNDLKNASAGRGGSSGNDVRNQMLIRNNAVSYGGNIVGQGGHVEINGGKSNVTFIVGVPDGGTMTSATALAASLKGSLVNCVTVTSTVAFKSAKVNFYVTGVTAGDNIAVYQAQNGKWVQLPTAEIRQDHVVVNMTRYGTIAFIRVPVLASVTY
ncbi:hypothetical protein [Butyrivibrio sp. VCB2006]|uniref:hypothetical protein n=1 Tax=Butyrivibrio sp. VCB2006 TaxID=1280679 RepID=UPI0004158F70|nr:hypothetical protein [Butyrivibrio sp. VCB2006]